MLVSFVLSFFPRDVLDEILNLIGSVSEGFPSYSFYMNVVKLVLNPQSPNHIRFDQSLMEYQEIRAHIQESPFSVHRVEFDPNMIVSCQDPLKCQNSEFMSKWNQFYMYDSSFLYRLPLQSSFHFVLEGLS